jgi:hypothetical protein
MIAAMKMRCFAFLVVLAASVSSAAADSVKFPDGGRVVTPKYHHLGGNPMEGWPEVPAQPEAERLSLTVTTEANKTEWLLAIRQRDVTERCGLRLNGKRLAVLRTNVEPGIMYYAVPPGVMQEGENSIEINPSHTRDNMVIGPIHLYKRPLREVLQTRQITTTVRDADTRKNVPARLTVTDLNGQPVELFFAQSTHTAVRLGTLYTMGTETTFELPPGQYKVYATRGMEWGRADHKLTVPRARSRQAITVPLTIRRELDTTGFIAADTHVHTLTHSGHGDANLDERMITLAGEGVELAIATDHNHNTDYLPHQEKLELGDYFTAVTGNEISSALGHLNAFPLDPKDPPPDHRLGDWVLLVDEARAKGAKVVILNHPRSPALANSPFTRQGLNRASGEFSRGARFPFDAMELQNPGGARPDPLYVLRDWFALLNHGERVAGVGASDSHTVDDPVGWARTYVPSATDDPAKIDVDDACERFLRGEVSVALGIFTDIRVDQRHTMGQTYSPKNGSVNVRLRVAAPSWVQPSRAIIYLNGQAIAEKAVPHVAGKPTDVWLDFTVPLSKHDAHLIGVVLGEGVDHPSIGYKSRVVDGKVQRINALFTLGVTNPVFLDTNGNGQYESPREQAGALLASAGSTLDQQWQTIMQTDQVIAVQMISLLRQQTREDQRAALDHRIRAAAADRPLFAEYARHALSADE